MFTLNPDLHAGSNSLAARKLSVTRQALQLRLPVMAVQLGKYIREFGLGLGLRLSVELHTWCFIMGEQPAQAALQDCSLGGTLDCLG